MAFEKYLGTLAGEDECTRVQLVQVAAPNETPTLEMRMERHIEGLGWTTHRRIVLAPGQIPNLRDALNSMDVDARDTKATADVRMQQRGLRLIG